MKRFAQNGLRLFVFSLLIMLGWNINAHAAGCGLSGDGQTQSVRVPGTERALLVHLPQDFDAATPAPLLFLFHGSTGTGAAMLKGSQLEATSDHNGFILVAPVGGIPADKGFVWNIPGVPTVTGKVPGPEDADDVAYVKATIDWLAAEGCIDRAKVYATGLSGGGRMTSWLACVAADRFAAIAPVVGLRAGNPRTEEKTRPDPATCQPSHPMPVIAFAGDKDTVNPIEGGGAGYWQYTMHAAEQRWAQLNACTTAPVTQWVANGVYEERYSGCQNEADVVGRITVGGTHTWVADNEAMWAFLKNHRRD
jgi:polyhydroxybutyrate depolymerase